MIIHICGTSGPGKTYAMRVLLSTAISKVPITRPDKLYPVGYDVLLPGVEAPVHILGGYEAALTGGCDTVKNPPFWYETIEAQHREGFHVLYEGLFMMNHMRGVELAQRTGALTVIHLNTPLDVCFERITERRKTTGNTRPLNEANTRGHIVRANNYCTKVKAVGAKVVRASSEEAPAVVMMLLRGLR